MFGNIQDYTARQLDAVFATVSGQDLTLSNAGSSFVAALNLSSAGNYSLSVWMESPRFSRPRLLVGEYTLTVNPEALAPTKALVQLT